LSALRHIFLGSLRVIDGRGIVFFASVPDSMYFLLVHGTLLLSADSKAQTSCIIACSNSPDEKSCQIKCGDTFENDVVGEFNACALSSKRCVPQRPDEGPAPGESKWTPLKGRYPVPPADSISQDFDVTKMTGRWYITAGLNPLFDTFDCQAHFFDMR